MAQTILVADDSATMRQVVTMAFKGSAFRVVAVGGGEEALQAAYDHRPSVVLLDYQMPDRSGFEVCRAMKADPNLRHIPVLMMGGAYHPFSEDEARRSGSDDVILKPFRTDAIHEKVTRLASAGASAAPEPSADPQGMRGAPIRGATQMGMPAVARPAPSAPPPAAPSQPRYGGGAAAPVPAPAPDPRREPVPAARFKSPGEPTKPAVLAPPTPQPAQATAANVDVEEIRRLVREEVQRAVREEMLTMVKSVLSDLFKERMMPKLLSYGQERVETIVTRDLQVIMERRVSEELARITGNE